MAARKKTAKQVKKNKKGAGKRANKSLRACSVCGKSGHNARTCLNGKRRANPKPPLNTGGTVSGRVSSKTMNLSNGPRAAPKEPPTVDPTVPFDTEASSSSVPVVDTTPPVTEELIEPSDIEAKSEAEEALEEAEASEDTLPEEPQVG